MGFGLEWLLGQSQLCVDRLGPWAWVVFNFSRAFLWQLGIPPLLRRHWQQLLPGATCIPQRPSNANRPRLAMFSLSFFNLHSSSSAMNTQLFSDCCQVYKVSAPLWVILILLRSSVHSFLTRRPTLSHSLTNFRRSLFRVSSSLVNPTVFRLQQCVIQPSRSSRHLPRPQR
jgi:hypothetical protein